MEVMLGILFVIVVVAGLCMTVMSLCFATQQAIENQFVSEFYSDMWADWYGNVLTLAIHLVVIVLSIPLVVVLAIAFAFRRWKRDQKTL